MAIDDDDRGRLANADVAHDRPVAADVANLIPNHGDSPPGVQRGDRARGRLIVDESRWKKKTTTVRWRRSARATMRGPLVRCRALRGEVRRQGDARASRLRESREIDADGTHAEGSAPMAPLGPGGRGPGRAPCGCGGRQALGPVRSSAWQSIAMSPPREAADAGA